MRHLKRRILSTVLTLGAAAGVLAACGGSTGSDSAATTTAASSDSTTAAAETTTASSGSSSGTKHANVGFFYMTATLDPAEDYFGWVVSRCATGEMLTKLDENTELQPWLAESWENKDDLTWEFKIRDGITFSNGKAVDAAACKSAIERAIGMSARAAEYLDVDTIEANGQTLTIKTKNPNGALPYNLVEPVFTILDTDQSLEDIQKGPICTGPYVITDFVSEQSIELEKNPNYWDGEAGLDTISVKYVSDSNSRAMAVQSGELDLANSIDYTALGQFADTSRYRTSTVTCTRVYTLALNNMEGRPTHDPEIRKAISYALDKDAYTEIYQGTPGIGPFSDCTAFGGSVENPYKMDKEKAKQVLEAAGYKDANGDGYVDNKDGSELKLVMIKGHGSGDQDALPVAIQSDLKAVGLKMEILQVENTSDYQKSGDFDLCANSSNTAPTGDAQTWFLQHYATAAGNADSTNVSNYTRYSNPKMDELIEKMKGTMDIEGRNALAKEGAEILLNDAADVYLVNLARNLVCDAKVKNIEQHPTDYYFITTDMTID